ncbi:MAG: CAP domain-containing protein [Bacteroidota bacterium]
MVILVILLYSFSFSDSLIPTWTQEELDKANTAKDISYLTDEEKKTIMLVNLARLDGKKFLQTYFQDYNATPFEEMQSSGNEYMVSLKRDLAKVKNLPMLLPDKNLSKAARYHAKDMGEKGKTGHISTNGIGMSKRLSKYVKGWNRLAENCSYGYDGAADIVGQLLLDENVPGLGHRKNILDTRLKYIGVAIEPHSRYRYNCVMDFCAKFKN